MDHEVCDNWCIDEAGAGAARDEGETDAGGRIQPVDVKLMTRDADTPDVSVILTTSNAAASVRQSIESVLAQTMTRFELIVVDDCSTDPTLPLVRGYDDPRVRLFATPQVLGPASARNQAVGVARGRYVAALSQGDMCAPTRLAAQLAYMESHADTVVLGTATKIAREDTLLPDRYPPHTTPAFVWWMLHVVNPLVWSSVMIRRDAIGAVDGFARDIFPFAEDYDLYHRLGAVGKIARLDEALVTRTWHEPADARLRDLRMTASAAKVLARTYQPWFGPASHAYAELMVVHIAAGRPVPEASTLNRIAAVFQSIERAFIAAYAPDEETRKLIGAEMSRLWWGAARAAIRSGSISQARVMEQRPDFAAPDGLTPKDLFRSGLIGTIRARRGS